MASPSISPSPGPSSGPANRHAPTAVERQRLQLEKLLKDPAKPAYVPAPPKEKTIRPAREMMKNVQGSSAGAGSGEFHVYKASRRREYERLKLMDETTQKEAAESEFEAQKRKWEEEANAKTSKNRAKRQKKKEKSKAKGIGGQEEGKKLAGAPSTANANGSVKKRRIVNGKELVFKRPGEEEDKDSEGDEDEIGPEPVEATEIPAPHTTVNEEAPRELVIDTPRIVIHDE